MKKSILVLLVLISVISLRAQQSFMEKYGFPEYDNSWASHNKFWKSDIIIVIPDNAGAISNYANDRLKYGENKNIKVAVKSESQLVKEDLRGNLLILGPIHYYSNWKKLGTPIAEVKHGFKVGARTFTDPSNGVSYVSDLTEAPMRMVYSGNSMDSYEQALIQNAVGFKYHIVENGIPAYFGNNTDLFDIIAFKKRHYSARESKYYTFMLSEDLNEEQLTIAAERFDRFDRHVEAFVRKLGLDIPKEKILTYIHAEQQEIKYMAAAYWSIAQEDDTMNGYAPPGDGIHAWGFYADHALEHETGHWLINGQLNSRPANFLSEGVQMWYLFTNMNDLRQQGFQMAKGFASEDLTDIICGKGDFFVGDKYYLISGIFTDYLMERYGIEAFKELYLYKQDEIFDGFEKIYGIPLSVILEDYKNWLLQDEIVRIQPQFSLIAHRGGVVDSGKNPENSIAALDEAIARGYAGTEIDVRQSKDGVLFLYHNRSFEHDYDSKGAGAEMTWTEIQALRPLKDSAKPPVTMEDYIKAKKS